MDTAKLVSTTIPTDHIQDTNKTESAENFKKCIYELFHKNGVLNDLRAYLRGHIVNVLRSSRAGEDELLPCQKHFTQRLEPKFQALNLLIAEYLLCMEFTYSFSVFVAEIPLANMVFDFAKTLMDIKPDGEASGLRFKDSDVWSILNRIGVQCDSEQANNIVQMYKRDDESPLLFCIMKCIQLCATKSNYTPHSLEESSSSCKTSEVESRAYSHHAQTPNKCSHSAFCKSCRSQFTRLQEKYGKKKKQFAKNSKQSVDPLIVEAFMKKVGFLERKLLDETLDHVKSVYEMEVNMVKSEQEESVKRSLAGHATHLHEKQAELEQTYKARSAALAGSLDRKKRFLWGLARALRAQHAQMARAMCAVRAHTERLAQKEKHIKKQLTNAEETLRKRCEQMHTQISGELINLEEHLESMKLERDVLHRERSELDDMKKDSENRMHESSDLRSHYDLLKKELITLKSYFESSLQKSKCFLESSTITELSGVNSNITIMNNEADRAAVKEEPRPTQVVNNLKKTNNINFGQPRPARAGGGASGSGARLRSDNERLRLLAEQQSAQLAEMTAHAARLQNALHRRPRTAPLRSTPRASSDSFGWCKGAGEELCFSLGRPQVLVPGDAVPFVGVVGERRAARCRHLVSQLRGARRRAAAGAGAGAGGAPAKTGRPWPVLRVSSKEQTGESADSRAISISSPPSTHCGLAAALPNRNERVNLTTVTEPKKPREKSPNSVLREAKERLRTTPSVPRAPAARAASPSGVLREAKLRLRKLEIEAEAAERSYMCFRRRRQDRADRDDDDKQTDDDENEDAHLAHEQRPEHSKTVKECNDLLKVNLEKYLTKYENQYDIGQIHFKNKNTVKDIKKPIPKEFSGHIENTIPIKRDFLNIPLQEFRNLYCPRSDGAENLETVPKEQPEDPNLLNTSELIKSAREQLAEVIKFRYNPKMDQKKNMTKIYNLQDVPTKEVVYTEPKEDKNLLRVEVESASRTSEATGASDRSMVLTVEGHVEPAPVYDSRLDSTSTVVVPTMTIVVSPKRPEEAPQGSGPSLTRSDVMQAIYKARARLRQRVDSGEESAEQESFSADVDNYAAGDEERAAPKTSDDDVSWG